MIEAGIRVIPLQEDKTPMKGFRWTEEVLSADEFKDLEGYYEKIGIACGKASDNIEVIDCDLKNDPGKEMFNMFIETVAYMNPELLPKLTVQSTINGGYHFIYKCLEIEGNKKLAKNAEGECVFETRGEGGYIVAAPSRGYKLKKDHSFENVQYITADERRLLHFVAKQLDLTPPEELPQIKEARKTGTGLSVFEDYNLNGDCTDIIKESWKYAGTRGQNVFFQRPGSKNKWGASYHVDKKVFYVFTSSSIFDQDKGYNNSQIYTKLKCNGDYKQSYIELKALGYGKDWKPLNEGLDFIKGSEKEPVDYKNFILDVDCDDQYIEDFRNGVIKPGLSFGYSDLDKHLVYKQSDYVLFIGFANVGKTTAILYLLTIICSKYPGQKWLLYVSENFTGMVKIIIMEFYLRMNIKSMGADDLIMGKKFLKDHFVFLNIDEGYTLRDLLSITEQVNAETPLTGVFIDPYSMILEEKSRDSFTYHNEMQNLVHRFKRKTKISPWISIHAISEAARKKDKDGFPVAPGQNDALFGVQFSGRADEVVTIHRLTKHPTRWNETEIHVHKVKETKTGGSPTPEGEPIILTMMPGGFKFINSLNEDPFDSSTYNRLQPNLKFDGNINERIEGKSIEEDVPF